MTGDQMKKPGRIGGESWMEARSPSVTAVYNANYLATGERDRTHDKPWSVAGPHGFKSFRTHAEAVAYAFEKAEKK